MRYRSPVLLAAAVSLAAAVPAASLSAQEQTPRERMKQVLNDARAQEQQKQQPQQQAQQAQQPIVRDPVVVRTEPREVRRDSRGNMPADKAAHKAAVQRMAHARTKAEKDAAKADLRAAKQQRKSARREVRSDRREIRSDRRELRSDRRELRSDRRELRSDRRELRSDRREARQDARQAPRGKGKK